jgi:hypothetical protein
MIAKREYGDKMEKGTNTNLRRKTDVNSTYPIAAGF